jgi:hypothetical protein
MNIYQFLNSLRRCCILATLLSCVFLIGCKKENDDTLSVVAIVDGKITAKIENASKYSDVVEVKLMGYDFGDGTPELARGDWKDDGFTIELPKTLDPNYLRALVNNDGLIINTPSTMTISNKNVKFVIANFKGFDKDGNVFTNFYPYNPYNKDGKRISLIYVDSDVTISGYNKTDVIGHCDGGDMYLEVLCIWEKTTTYSIKWEKGWNVWCLSSSESIKKRTMTEKWSTIPVSKLKWYGQ